MPNLLRIKLMIEERNGDLLRKLQELSSLVRGLKGNPVVKIAMTFRIRCLERLYVLSKLAADNCLTGFPVAATLMARGVIETAGLLVLFDTKISKLNIKTSDEKLNAIKKFVFATKKFGNEKKAVHVLDCVRALKPFHPDVEVLYDLLCECVHPNWLGVTQFKEFQPQSNNDVNEYDELVYTVVFQSLLLGHKIAHSFDFKASIENS